MRQLTSILPDMKSGETKAEKIRIFLTHPLVLVILACAVASGAYAVNHAGPGEAVPEEEITAAKTEREIIVPEIKGSTAPQKEDAEEDEEERDTKEDISAEGEAPGIYDEKETIHYI